VFHLARRLKGLGNRICDAVAGRTTHPVSILVGGMARMPEASQLRELRAELSASLEDLQMTVGVFATLGIPSFVRETEFVSLKGEGSYPWIGGRLISSDGVERAEREYRAMTNEVVVEHSTSKWCHLSRESLAVGSLARFNNNHRFLRPEAVRVAERLGLRPVCHNPFMNNVAQLVECVQVVHESVDLIDALLADPGAETRAAVNPRAGEGTGAVEVPRGILYHHYEYDSEGRIRRADCVIPTTQNNANIHHDLGALVRSLAAGLTDARLEQLCSMLVRAYDPCISCSVH
jgi:coenzyme F420-reducing hydrogenase alpha subunit